jgi:hypothetical protein
MGIALVALGFVVTNAAMGPRPGVTEANVRRLERGMTKEQVAAILGVPARSVEPMFAGGQGSVHTWVDGPGGRVYLVFGHGGERLYLARFEQTKGSSPLAASGHGWAGDAPTLGLD